MLEDGVIEEGKLGLIMVPGESNEGRNGDSARATHGASSETFSIGDLSREFGVTLRALRFYEDRGLITPVREGQSRRYSHRDRARLAVILKGKKLGFTLTEIRDMVAKADQADLEMSPDTVREQIVLLERQRQEIDEALAELRQNLDALSETAKHLDP